MKFYILTLFPDMVSQGLNTSIIGRAAAKGLLHIECINIRDYTKDKHKKVDDYPYGGGAGMLMQAQPVYDAWRSVAQRIGGRPRTVYLTPQGRTFDQGQAKELALETDLVLLCGHYEGIDERVLEEIVTDYVSIGDYVLTGGELAAMVVADAVSRMVPGVLSNDASGSLESFEGSLLGISAVFTTGGVDGEKGAQDTALGRPCKGGCMAAGAVCDPHRHAQTGSSGKSGAE